MRLLIAGYYGFGNFGDDLLLSCVHAMVRKRFPCADIFIFANYSENLSGANVEAGYRDYIHNMLDGRVSLIDWTYKGHFDLIVHGGGGVFFDNNCGQFSDRVNDWVVSLLGVRRYRKLTQLARLALNRNESLTCDRRIGLGIGVGPYTNNSPRLWKEAEILGDFHRLAVRDDESHVWACRHGLAKFTQKFTDIVFGVSNWMPNELNSPRPSSNVLGIVLCSKKKGNEAVLATLEGLKSQNLALKFFFLDQHYDSDLIQRVGQLGYQTVVWNPWRMSLIEFSTQLAECSLLVSNRAHGAIVGACVGVPSICIATDPKLRSVHAMLPTGSLLIEISAIETQLTALVLKTLNKLNEFQRCLKDDTIQREQEVLNMMAYTFD
jgi:polysaccharide pyruvyl transferase WcaK-like protein